MKILITSGGTIEKIDSVRGITNHSSGQTGKEIAQLFLDHGHEVTLVTTSSAVKPELHPHLSMTIISNVAELAACLEPLVKEHDCFIHAMAVSDYTPVYMTDMEELLATSNPLDLLEKRNGESKISSQSDYQVLFLKKTPKIISLVKQWNPAIQLIGFKLLVNVSEDELISVARDSLEYNKASAIITNDLNNISKDRHQAFLVTSDKAEKLESNQQIAQAIFERVTSYDK
ncbi:phosphopantothenate--cysteine ligase [Streptococcus hongkongensis]|nr:phosphopantothenate--cysteine ligase [Streptococcus uberis]